MEKEMEAEETAPLTEEQPAPTPIVPLEKPTAAPKPTVTVTPEEISITLGEIQRETEEGTGAGGAFRDNITFHTKIGRGEDREKFDVIIKHLLASGQIVEKTPGSGIYLYKEIKQPAAAKKPTVTTPAPAVTQPTPTPKVIQPPAPPIKPIKILSTEDMRRLQDYWNTQFFRQLGKVPASISSVFRVEFEGVKLLPFEEAKEKILAAADDIISEIRARQAVFKGERVRPEPQPRTQPKPAHRPGRTDREIEEDNEEGGFSGLGNVPPASFPPAPLSIMQPFPRGPTSEEKLVLWRVFCYQMRQKGFNCDDFQRPYDDYIEKSQFLSWEDLKNRFTFVLETLAEGARLPPLVQWRSRLTTPTGLRGELREMEPSPDAAKLTAGQIEEEEKNAVKRQRILISHWAAALIHQARYYNKVKTMHDLYDEVVDRGVIDASIPEEIFLPIAKEAIREIYSQKLRPIEKMKTDGEEEEVEKLNLAKVPYVDISQRELDAFLASV
jgi:hypothetical protein